MARLKADLWIAAFLRQHNAVGDFCVVSRKGDPDAGQIWVEIDHLNGKLSLLSPAPTNPDATEREFALKVDQGDAGEIRSRLERESEFDPDFWVISIETRKSDLGLTIIDLA